MACILPETMKDVKRVILENGGMGGMRSLTYQEKIDLFSPIVDIPGHTETSEMLVRRIDEYLIKGQSYNLNEFFDRATKKGLNIRDKKGLIDRITSKKDVFNPKSYFSESLAKQALGYEVSQEDAKDLFDLVDSANELKKNLLRIEPAYLSMNEKKLKELPETTQKARMELGKKLVDIQHKYEELSLKAQAQELKDSGTPNKVWEFILKVAGNIKSLKASVDFSFLRQLQSTAYVNIHSFKGAMKAGYKAWFSSKEGVDTMLAEILTRPNALNGNYNKFSIEVGIKEEAFPESWISQLLDKTPTLEKINLLRRSESSFNIAMQTARANLFDWMWEQSNGDGNLLEAQGIGKAINTVTGRGENRLLTPKDPKTQRIINNLMFAPKWLASRIQAFTDLRFVGELGKMTPQGIRARAAVGNLIIIAAIMALKGFLWARDDDDDRDLGTVFSTTSSDFGKIVIGNTRFDLTASTGNLITLASRLWRGKYINSKGVEKTMQPMTALGNFLKGKRSPGISTAIQIKNIVTEGKVKDFWGKEIGAGTAITDAFAPISVQNAIELIGSESEGIDFWGELAGMVADFIGIGSNTYSNKGAKK